MKGTTTMYAICFDLEIEELKKTYGETYNNAYADIRKILNAQGFTWAQGSLYLSKQDNNNLTTVYKAIDALKQIEWFRKSVRNIQAFIVEEWSDFTDIVKF